MPGPLYRMHGAVTGAYDIPNVDVTNRIVLTNKMPASLIRGFGGPQLYLAIERLVQRIAVELGLDHLDVIRRNLIPEAKFPYRAAAGRPLRFRRLPRARRNRGRRRTARGAARKRDEARAAGKLYGIGFATVVEPGMSNMGYLSTLLSADARDRAGPKNGAVSMVTVNVDPLGSVSMTADVTVQGQGHETVLSQIVADRLGLAPDDIEVSLALDTGKDPWSIAAGSYSCRFTPGTAVAAHLAADQMRDKLAAIAAKQLNMPPRRHRVRRRADPQPLQSRQRAAVFARRRHRALVAGDAAQGDGARPVGNRGVVAARARAADPRRPHQHLAHLRFRVRHVRGGGRSHDLPGPDRPLRLHA